MDNFVKTTLNPLILRIALGVILITLGFGKISGAGNEMGAKWATEYSGPPSELLQLGVAWGELLCGIALVLGLATRLAALATGLLMAGAIYWITGNAGFAFYKYNIAISAMCLVLILSGPGPLSLDRLFRKPKT